MIRLSIAKEEGITPQEVADKYIAVFVRCDGFGCQACDPPSAGGGVYVADIIRFVEDLIDKGYAYESEGDVYFRVVSSQFMPN